VNDKDLKWCCVCNFDEKKYDYTFNTMKFQRENDTKISNSNVVHELFDIYS